jgi:hypothetical protein
VRLAAATAQLERERDATKAITDMAAAAAASATTINPHAGGGAAWIAADDASRAHHRRQWRARMRHGGTAAGCLMQ